MRQIKIAFLAFTVVSSIAVTVSGQHAYFERQQAVDPGVTASTYSTATVFDFFIYGLSGSAGTTDNHEGSLTIDAGDLRRVFGRSTAEVSKHLSETEISLAAVGDRTEREFNDTCKSSFVAQSKVEGPIAPHGPGLASASAISEGRANIKTVYEVSADTFAEDLENIWIGATINLKVEINDAEALKEASLKRHINGSYVHATYSPTRNEWTIKRRLQTVVDGETIFPPEEIIVVDGASLDREEHLSFVTENPTSFSVVQFTQYEIKSVATDLGPLEKPVEFSIQNKVTVGGHASE